MDWYTIEILDDGIRLDVRPPDRDAWEERILFKDVERVCYEAGDFLMSDTIYIFVRGREHSYAIPTEGEGGPELWGALVKAGLFDGRLAIEAATAEAGTILCWPEVNRD